VSPHCSITGNLFKFSRLSKSWARIDNAAKGAEFLTLCIFPDFQSFGAQDRERRAFCIDSVTPEKGRKTTSEFGKNTSFNPYQGVSASKSGTPRTFSPEI
jgi:hypothetical protein